MELFQTTKGVFILCPNKIRQYIIYVSFYFVDEDKEF